MKKLLSILLCLSILLTTACHRETTPDKTVKPTDPSAAPIVEATDEATGTTLKAAVLYSEGDAWKDTLSYLRQSPMLNLESAGLQWQENTSLDSLQIIYADDSLLQAQDEGWKSALINFTEHGGAVFLTNSLLPEMPTDYLGISSLVRLDGCLNDASYPACDGDLSSVQQVIKDFSALYPSYANYHTLAQEDYGWGIVPDGASPLANWGKTTVYAMNQYGSGIVFLSNPLLPNEFSCGSLTMADEQSTSPYASTTTSFNMLLLSGFAEYVSKCLYGYALERVYGYFGTPSMSWELHYEEITGIANDSLGIFSRLCEQYRQIPSLTLIRNSYYWFRRAESGSYLINEGNNTFGMDFYENAYSSGTHIAEEDDWLCGEIVENGGSYFLDYPEFTNRAYLFPADYDGDGNLDLLRGSQNGKIYFHQGLGMVNGRLKVKAGTVLTDLNANDLCYGEYSAACLEDIDLDGVLDLICGWADGNVRWFKGNGTTGFEPMGILMDMCVQAQALPIFGDFNSDGISDLCVGSDNGTLIVYYGKIAQGRIQYAHGDAYSFGKLCVNESLGSWLSPCAVDYNRDGSLDLAVGTYDGYIALFLAQADGSYAFESYLTTQEMNYKGNHNLKFGNWVTPSFADLDADGDLDLLCGYQEYGMAYPIDSEYFPYAKELKNQIEYAQENDFYVGIHFYTNAYASAEREAYELRAHEAAFEKYGLSSDTIGANQHTWYTSTLDSAQSMTSIYDAGLYWQSGFASPNAYATTPQTAAENVVSLPFFLEQGDEQTTLIQNNSVVMYASDDWCALSARYHMPVCLYYHCDFAYESDAESIKNIEMAQKFRDQYGYNFNREDQLMLASAAALHQKVQAEGTLFDSGALTLTSFLDSTDFELYSSDVSQSLGIRVLLSDSIDPNTIEIDADVWIRGEREIIVGANRTVRLSVSEASEETSHISRINMAADITMLKNGARIEFLSGGMMELAVQGNATTTSAGWTVTQQNGETIFTKYGSNEALELTFEP